MYLQTVTRISQLALGQPVVFWPPASPGNPLCLVVARVWQDTTAPSWTASTATLQMRHGGFRTEVRQDNLVNDYQVPWHQVPRSVDRDQRWRRVALAACTWCPRDSQSPAALLTRKGHPVCADHARALLATPTSSHRIEWAVESVAAVYAALGLA